MRQEKSFKEFIRVRNDQRAKLRKEGLRDLFMKLWAVFSMIVVFINLAAGVVDINHQFPVWWFVLSTLTWFGFLAGFKYASKERWKKVNIGTVAEAESSSLGYGEEKKKYFMDGFRYARNRLQKEKAKIINNS